MIAMDNGKNTSKELQKNQPSLMNKTQGIIKTKID